MGNQQIKLTPITDSKWSLLGLSTALCCCAGILLSVAASADTVTFVGWGGSIGRAQQKSFFEPFERSTGHKVEMVDYNGGLAQVRAQVETKVVIWDVIDTVPADVVRGCDEGMFERIDPASLPVGTNGESPGSDYLPGTLTDCGVGVNVWANVFAYDPVRFTNGGPKTIADVFNIAKFPGKRGLNRSPQANLEWALMADGVPANKVYEVLATDAGVNRAFEMLDRIKPHVVWWETGAQAPQLLADGEVTITSAYNGRIYNAVKKEGKNFITIWDGQVWDYAPVAILKGSPNKKAAMQLVAFIARPDIMPRLTQYISYGPVRASAMVNVDATVKSDLGTYSGHMKTALQSDTGFWADHADELKERFSTWLAR